MSGRTTEEYYSTRHAKYYCGYHFVWIPKYRRNILVGSVAERLKELIIQIAEQDLDCKVKALEVMPDHIHLFVVCPPLSTSAPNCIKAARTGSSRCRPRPLTAAGLPTAALGTPGPPLVKTNKLD